MAGPAAARRDQIILRHDGTGRGFVRCQQHRDADGATREQLCHQRSQVVRHRSRQPGLQAADRRRRHEPGGHERPSALDAARAEGHAGREGRAQSLRAEPRGSSHPPYRTAVRGCGGAGREPAGRRGCGLPDRSGAARPGAGAPLHACHWPLRGAHPADGGTRLPPQHLRQDHPRVQLRAGGHRGIPPGAGTGPAAGAAHRLAAGPGGQQGGPQGRIPDQGRRRPRLSRHLQPRHPDLRRHGRHGGCALRRRARHRQGVPHL